MALLTSTWMRVLSMLSDRGYQLAWLILDVPNGMIKRSRFFIYGKLESADTLEVINTFKAAATAHPPCVAAAAPPEEQRMLRRSEYSNVEQRLKMIGNLVVPYQGLWAFNYLIKQLGC